MINREIAYPNIYVINLDRNKDRLENIKSYFESNQIQFERFTAVDGKSIISLEAQKTINNLRKSKYPGSNHILSIGEIGCASSHLKLYEKLLASDQEYFIIIEDDVEFDKNFKLFLEQINKLSKIDFDVLFLGYFGSEINDAKNHCRESAILKFKGKLKLSNLFTIGIPAHRLWTTMGYIVSRNGAEKMVNLNPDLTLLADELTSDSNEFGLKTYSLNPPVIYPSLLGFPTETESNHIVQKRQSVNILKNLWRIILNSRIIIRLKLFCRQFNILFF